MGRKTKINKMMKLTTEDGNTQMTGKAMEQETGMKTTKE